MLISAVPLSASSERSSPLTPLAAGESPSPASGRGEERPSGRTGWVQARELSHVPRDLHRAEFGTAHAAEMRGLGAFGGEHLVVEGLGPPLDAP